jgi:chromosome segregation ATPase
MPDVDCHKLQAEVNAAKDAGKEALNEFLTRDSELRRAADRIDDAHDWFDTNNMTPREIVDAQLDVIERDREGTAERIRELNWNDPGGRNEELLNELNQHMADLDDTQEYLGHLNEEWDKASDKFDEAEQTKSDSVANWSEHCDEDPPPPEEDEDEDEGDKPRPPRHHEEQPTPPTPP